jgi:hypothetical protein
LAAKGAQQRNAHEWPQPDPAIRDIVSAGHFPPLVGAQHPPSGGERGMSPSTPPSGGSAGDKAGPMLEPERSSTVRRLTKRQTETARPAAEVGQFQEMVTRYQPPRGVAG